MSKKENIKKKLYLVCIESPEMQAMFDEKFNMIDCWSLNDACWRDEYFSLVMDHIGVEIMTNMNAKIKKQLVTKLQKEADETYS